MKKNIPFIILLSALLTAAGCTKRINTPQEPGNSLILAYPTGNTFNSLSSGLDNFNNALLNFSLNDVTDTLLFSATLIGTGVPNAAGADIHVTVGVDSGLVAAYNIDTALMPDTAHQSLALMPAAYYSLVNTTGVIPAGQNQVAFKLVFYPSLFDISKTGYLLPVSIITASPGSVNPTMKTVYFHIYKDPYPAYNRALWTVLGVDSQELVGEPGNGAAPYCLDGNTATYWHTQWDVAVPPGFPHWIKIDMGAAQTLHGFSFLPRQSGGNAGDKFKDITVLATNDTSNWQQAGQFTLQNVFSLQKVNLSNPVPDVRYFEIIINDNYDTNPWTNLAELYAF
jgi:hypothetical protein